MSYTSTIKYKGNVIATLQENEDVELDCAGTVMDGDIDVFLGVAGNSKELLRLASAYAQEELEEFDEDAYDALCELINIMNGAYATRLCNEDIDVTLHPPVFYRNTEVTADNGLYVVTFAMGDNLFKILMAADDKIRLSA